MPVINDLISVETNTSRHSSDLCVNFNGHSITVLTAFRIYCIHSLYLCFFFQTLYDMLMDMLDERGIDDTFINNMVDFATAYEHNQYVEFLEKLRTVVKEWTFWLNQSWTYKSQSAVKHTVKFCWQNFKGPFLHIHLSYSVNLL